jgi:hypothetical protein
MESDAVYTATAVGAWDVPVRKMRTPHTWHFATALTVLFAMHLSGAAQGRWARR